MKVEEVVAVAGMNIPTWEQLLRVLPVTFTVLLILAYGGLAVKWIMSDHIKTLKEIIEYLKKGKGG